MRKLVLTILILLFSTSLSFSAPSIRVDNVIIDPLVDTSAVIGVYILGTESEPVDSAAFTVAEIAGLSWSVTSFTPPAGWSPIVSPPLFGATDFGWPPTPISISGEYKYAEITLSWDFSIESDFKAAFIPTKSHTFGFSNYELADKDANVYANLSVDGGIISAVPIPSSLLLLGGGLFALLGITRRKRG